LTHGLPSSHREWDPMSEVLVANGYRTIALDLPGHGESLKPDEVEFYSADTFYQYFQEWIEHFNLPEPPVLVGHSFGGYLCLRYTLEHPQSVSGLVLINPFMAYDQLSDSVRLMLSNPRFLVRFLRKAPFKMVKGVVWLGSLSRRKSRLVSFLSKRQLQQSAVDYKRVSTNIVFLPRTVNNITTNLSDLKTPSLLIWGNQDTTLSVSWFLDMATQLPDLIYKAVNAGHSAHVSNFNEVYPVVLKFLKSVTAL
jgi:pimeloyl-ACP methyl ester carboxylesterase